MLDVFVQTAVQGKKGTEMSEYTKWYPADVPPARDGVYQIKKVGGFYYRKFEDGWWHYGHATARHAAVEREVVPLWMIKPWRGLKEEPK